jgi:predicted membrane chloride channel (bestrophin family)
VSLSAVIGQSLTVDVGRASIIALSVLVLSGGMRLLWGWLMKSAREDFRDSIGKVVDEKIGSISASLSTMSADLGALAEALKEERRERDDLRKLIADAIDDLTQGHEETLRSHEETRKTLVVHGSWIEQIAAGAGIVLDPDVRS